MATYITNSRQIIHTIDEIGRGGEGSVYTISGMKNYVAKVYHTALCSPTLEDKLIIMVKNPPHDDTRRLDPPHISITWPVELIYANNRFAGYIMPFIRKCPDLYKVFNPILRNNYYPAFDRRYLHRTARNISAALNAFHSRGYVIGDINQKNILVTDRAMITFIDVDSVQVPHGNGRMFRCCVGVPEYTPPELHGVPIENVNRTVLHDYFGLAVIIFQLLMQGFHPFSGRPKDPKASVQEEFFIKCMVNGLFPYHSNTRLDPPPMAPKYDILYPELRGLFSKCFVEGFNSPSLRPTAYDWILALDKAEKALVQCPHKKAHWYSEHLRECPSCPGKKRRKPSTKRKKSSKQVYTINQKVIAIKGIRFFMNYVPSGKFTMGSPVKESAYRNRDEKLHKVTISRGYWIMETPVTFDIFIAICGFDPCWTISQKNMKYPVINVSWNEASYFCTRLSMITGMGCRLPTEAEWEYACRAGTDTPYYFGKSINKSMANYDESLSPTGPVKLYTPENIHVSPVKTYRPNALGLYDMHGNVWEWCNDLHGPYPSGHTSDPTGPPMHKSKAGLRIVRGGSWTSPLNELRSACRRSGMPDIGNYATGFRVVFMDI